MLVLQIIPKFDLDIIAIDSIPFTLNFAIWKKTETE